MDQSPPTHRPEPGLRAHLFVMSRTVAQADAARTGAECEPNLGWDGINAIKPSS